MKSSRILPVITALTTAFRRFPFVVVASLIATIAAIVSAHSHVFHSNILERLIMTMIFACPVFVAAEFLGEYRSQLRWVASIAGLLAVIGVWNMIPVATDHWFQVFFYHYFMMLLTAFALISLLPGLVSGFDGNWWRVNVGIINALFLAAILSGIVLMGLEIALFSIEKLFHFSIEKLYGDIGSICGLFFGPMAIIALFPQFRDELNPSQPGFAFWANLCKWVLIPLGFLFIAILAVYSGCILLKWRLPNGMVATPVLSLGAYGTAAMLLLQPWKENRSWARIFALIYPPAFLLASVLLFISLETRIRAYGVTFDRYFALVAGIWFALSALCFLLRYRSSVILVPSLMALFSLAAAVGPLSAGSTTLRSQTARLRTYLALPFNDQKKSVQKIRSTLLCLGDNFSPSVVEAITGPLNIDDDRTRFNGYTVTNAALKKLGLSDNTTLDDWKSYSWNGKNPLPVGGYQGLYVPQQYNIQFLNSADGDSLELKLVDETLAFYSSEKKLTEVNLDLIKPNHYAAGMPPMVEMKVEGRDFLIIITNMQWTEPSDGPKKNIQTIGYFVLEK